MAELIGYEKPRKGISVKNTGTIKEVGYSVEKLLLERDSERKFLLPALLFIPDGTKGKVVATVMVSDEGKKSLLHSGSELHKALERGQIVLAVDITNSVELDDKIRKTVGKSTVFTPKFALYEGKTLIGYQCEDIIVASRYLQSHKSVDKSKIDLYAVGNAGYAALHATAISGDFNQVELVGEVKSWENVATEAYHSNKQLWRLDNIVPDVLNCYDIPNVKNICIKSNIKVVQRNKPDEL